MDKGMDVQIIYSNTGEVNNLGSMNNFNYLGYILNDGRVLISSSFGRIDNKICLYYNKYGSDDQYHQDYIPKDLNNDILVVFGIKTKEDLSEIFSSYSYFVSENDDWQIKYSDIGTHGVYYSDNGDFYLAELDEFRKTYKSKNRKMSDSLILDKNLSLEKVNSSLDYLSWASEFIPDQNIKTTAKGILLFVKNVVKFEGSYTTLVKRAYKRAIVDGEILSIDECINNNFENLTIKGYYYICEESSGNYYSGYISKSPIDINHLNLNQCYPAYFSKGGSKVYTANISELNNYKGQSYIFFTFDYSSDTKIYVHDIISID